MAIWLSTLGVQLAYGVETIAGTKPETFTSITGIKSIPDLNPEPNSIQVTPLSETQYHQYVDGLKDISGALSFGANLTEAFITEWEAIYSAYTTAKETGKKVWFEIYHPELTKGFFFIGNPSPLGLSAMEVDASLDINVYVVPTEVKGYDTAIKPTAPSA